MTHADFVHLRVHSAYSLSEGAIKIDELIRLCDDHSMPAVAITDTGNLFGALEFALAAAKQGVQPIIGCQIAVIREDPDETFNGNGSARANGLRDLTDVLVLLAQSDAGYRNLLKLVSHSYLNSDGGAASVELADIAALSDGLIALTGGADGAVGRLLSEGQLQRARGMLESLAAVFPGRLYVEVTRHGLEIERRIEDDLVGLAYDYDLPLVASNDVHFANADMHDAHDALLCIAQGTHVAATDRRRLTPDHRFRSADEMLALFADLPEAIDNTLVIARRCAFMPVVHEPILPPFPTPDGYTEADQLGTAARTGLQARIEASVYLPDMDEAAREEASRRYWERLDFELEVIIKMGFPGYFLIVADFIQWAKNQGIPVGPGRGSGAGSVVAWSLTITDLDPIELGLLFERFLNPDRVSMPDFDIDFCQDRRDEVIRYVQGKYGADRVAQIITFGKLQARAALRDVGRVLGMPYGQVDRIAKLVPFNPANPPTLTEAIEKEPQLQELRDGDESVGRLIDYAMKLEGLYRHASTHAAGVVIGDRPLHELLPLYRDPRSDMVATQFSMKYTELAGLVKFDFLGLKTLTVLSRAVKHLAARGVEIDLLHLPPNDEATYAMLGRGDATGVFQMESSGMRDVLRKMKPDSFGDLIALVALYRPGPMDNIPRYIACKHGRELPDYLHPDLEEILRETFGVMIYQEQVMQIAQKLSSFSLSGADLLRRAMGKKIKSEMDAQRDAFIDGAAARGVDKAQASRIFEQVDKFAGYGFNKSHAAAYALIAYQTAYLKANHPVEFFAATMTLDLGNTDKLNVLRDELKRLDIPLLPPDVNRSGVEFTVETIGNGTERGAIRYALAAIKNVGRQAMADVINDREINGPFSDEFDFAARLGGKATNKRQLENLVRAGALDDLNSNRRQVFENVENLVRHGAAATNDRESNQQSLFGEAGAELPPPTDRRPDVPDWPKMERLAHESEAVGLYLSAHPLDVYTERLKRLRVTPFADLAGSTTGTTVRLAGVVLDKQERTSAKGNRFAFVQLTDASGQYEVVVFSELLAVSRELLEANSRVLLSAEARADGDGVRLNALSVAPLDEALAEAAKGLMVFVAGTDGLETLKRAIADGAKGPGRISLVIDVSGQREVEIALPGGYALSGEMMAAIESAPGVTQVHEL
jgi:DNA polymerase-3 subunit alpha